jgi:hypothetical protein
LMRTIQARISCPFSEAGSTPSRPAFRHRQTARDLTRMPRTEPSTVRHSPRVRRTGKLHSPSSRLPIQ